MCQTPPRFPWDMIAINNKFRALRKCFYPSSANIQLPLYDIWRGTMAGLFCDKGLQTLQGGNIHLNWIFVKLELTTLIARFFQIMLGKLMKTYLKHPAAFCIPTAIYIKGKNHNHILGFWVLSKWSMQLWSEFSFLCCLLISLAHGNEWQRLTPVTCDDSVRTLWFCSRKSTSSMID